MKKLLLILLLPVLIGTGQLLAQVTPATQGVDCGGIATITVAVNGARYYATTTGGLVISDNGVDKALLVTTQGSLTVRAASGSGEVLISLASNPDVVVGRAAVTINDLPVGDISGTNVSNGLSCIPSNGTATYSIPTIPGANYIWRITNGGSHTRIIGAANTNTVTVESINEGNSSITVYVYNDCTAELCKSIPKSIQIKKTFTLAPDETFGGPACMDASVLGEDNILVYSVKPYLGLYNTRNDYAWTLSAGLEELYRSADGSSISIRVNNPDVDQQVSIVVGAACNGQSNTLTKILKAPAPAPTFASESFCVSDVSGTQATFAVTNNPDGKFSYNWILPANWTIVSSNGPDKTQVTIQFNNTGPGNITVAASHDGCGTKFSTFGVNRYPAVASPISGTTCVAFGATAPLTYSVQGGGSNTYKWEVIPASAAWAVTTGNGASIDIIPAFGNIPASGQVEVRATIEGNCGTAPVVSSLMVSVGPGKPAAITGTACVPFGTGSLTYSIAPVLRATGYKWTIPPSWSVTGGTDGTSVSVNTNNTNGQLKVAALGCSVAATSAETTLDVTMGPPLPGNITGLECVAYGTTGMTYSIGAVANATGYEWQVPSGWTNSISTDGLTITITGTNNTSGDVRVRALGCSSGAHSAFKALTVNVGPPQPGLITGPTCITPSGGNLVYSVTPVANANGYTWNFPSGWLVQGSDNSASINVIPSGNGGEVGVVALGCNAGTNSAKRAVTVTPAPAQPGVITYDVFDGNPTSVNTCIGKGAVQSVTFSIPAQVPGAQNYTWTFPAAWNAAPIITTGLTATVSTDATSGGEISVVANGSATGCNSQARTLQAVRGGLEFCVDVFTIPGFKGYAVMEETITNGTPPYTYAWYVGTLTGTPVGTESAYFASASSLGTKTVFVVIHEDGGCTTTLEIPGTVTPAQDICTPGGIMPLAATARISTGANSSAAKQIVSSESVSGSSLKLFPNPSADDINIVLPENAGRASVNIYNAAGTLTKALSSVEKETKVDIRDYPNGTYIVLVRTASGILHDKFIVKH